jgi:hypothetical protein
LAGGRGSRRVALIVFTRVATVIFHDFWNLTGSQQINQMLHAFKNGGRSSRRDRTLVTRLAFEARPLMRSIAH